MILRCIDSFLSCHCGQTVHGTVRDDLSEISTDVIYSNVSSAFSKLSDGLSTSNKLGAVVLIIDDNMYYSSMRYQLYQLARKCE